MRNTGQKAVQLPVLASSIVLKSVGMIQSFMGALHHIHVCTTFELYYVFWARQSVASSLCQTQECLRTQNYQQNI